METSLCTMVIHLYPAIKSNIQFISSLSTAKWLWSRATDTFSEDESFKKCLKQAELGVPHSKIQVELD